MSRPWSRWWAQSAALIFLVGTAQATEPAELKAKADRLAQEARALAKSSGCGAVAQCEVAGFGHKACGGPREFIAYCTRTTNVPALQAKLDALTQAERDWQQAAGLRSNCGLTRRPRPRLEDGRCVAR
ncbi:hypothetical protein KRR26_23745 [Corallococcus sp. M34]|uniref:hypothetical protein n=1 Tax=Citreicoccus inhibens TaxID=2849499 RepID=UPI001C238FEF|nr:hypothetical protein [Citreicoccus inhibens]MBU8898628.1 hypothetical protein [Citreicoccus inhibens]